MMGFTESGQPDPEFKAWFASTWKELTLATEVPGMQYASWDRKAAYLLWRLADRDLDLSDAAALLRYVKTGNVNVPAATAPTVGKATEWHSDVPTWGTRPPMINPVPRPASAPAVGGVSFVFDSSKR